METTCHRSWNQASWDVKQYLHETWSKTQGVLPYSDLFDVTLDDALKLRKGEKSISCDLICGTFKNAYMQQMMHCHQMICNADSKRAN